jgi:hypothetical protein
LTLTQPGGLPPYRLSTGGHGGGAAGTLSKEPPMDYLAQLLSDQLMAERHAEAARHNLAKQARAPRVVRTRLPRWAGLLGLLRLLRPTARPTSAEGTP